MDIIVSFLGMLSIRAAQIKLAGRLFGLTQGSETHIWWVRIRTENMLSAVLQYI